MAQPDASSATDRAHLRLRGLLTSDEVHPGDHLTEVALGEWLGMSRTPVRAALQRLEHEQLVRRGPHGYVVAGLTPRDVREACDALRLVDTALFQRAAERIQPDQVAELHRCVTRMEAGADDVQAWNDADLRFHEILAAASDHSLFSHVARSQRRRLHRFWTRSAVGSRRLEACADEHARVVAAVGAADDAEIARLVHEHIDHMEKGMLGLLELATPFLPTDGPVLEHA